MIGSSVSSSIVPSITWAAYSYSMSNTFCLIVPMVLVLGILNTIGTDGSIGKEDTEDSVLSVVGKAVTPVFRPIGIDENNWQASVAIFTGLFAKEAVVGTLKGLYGQGESVEAPNEDEFSFWGGIKDAFVSVPENLKSIWVSLVDPIGLKKAEADANGGESEFTLGAIRKHFPKGINQAFSFLLFVLLYVPCLAATGVVFREIGGFYGSIFVGYLTVLGWSSATLFHAIAVSGSVLWGGVAISLLVAMFGGFWLYGKKHKVTLS